MLMMMHLFSPVRVPIRTAIFAAAAAPVLLFSVAAGAQTDPPREQIEFFESKIRPVLVEHCYSCHSHEAKKLKAGLFLDSRDGALKGGDTGPALLPGEPQKSLIIEAISYKNVDMQMPPKTKLSEAQIADLTQWVKLGAPWPKEAAKTAKVEKFDIKERRDSHWCWQPVKAVAPPAVKAKDWPRGAIDRFVLAKLEDRGLTPAGDADPRTLVRRIYFDLIGLPPTAEEVAEFLKDCEGQGPGAKGQGAKSLTPLPLREGPGEGRASDNPKAPVQPGTQGDSASNPPPAPPWKGGEPIPQSAIEKLVDKLLASPHFGEKWGRHWLDLMRYGETCGHEFEYPIPHAWRYRDYVIRALNADVPYNQFVVEHIAGDLLPKPRRNTAEDFNESVLATGFYHLHEATHAPVDVKLDQATRFDNQIDVISKSFLGLTVACARCHDHKFDPISTKDYYALYGFLRSSRRQEALIDPGRKIETLVSQIKAEQSKGQAAFNAIAPKDSKAAAASVAAYLLAAREVIAGTPAAVAAAPPAPRGDKPAGKDILFEDFESGTYANWKVQGNAFGKKPQTQQTLADYQGDVNAQGKWFVNSHVFSNGNVPAGDSLTGSLTSKPFTIERRYIRMLVGGGAHAGKTCVNVLIDGNVVGSVTGRELNRMDWTQIDVAALAGKQATLQIVDQHNAGWGNIGVDHITFTDEALSGAPVALAAPQGAVSRPVVEVAKERGLDAAALQRVVQTLQGDAKEPSHPLHGWARLIAETRGKPDANAVKAAAQRVAGEIAQGVQDWEYRLNQEQVFTTFSGKDFAGWRATGDAFGSAPTQPGTWDSAAGEPAALDAGVVSSGAVAAKLRGVIRSPSFTITRPVISYRVRGSGQIRLIIENYVMDVYNGLLFGGVSFRVDTKGKWAWHAQAGDASRYVGYTAHIEVIDDGDETIAVDEIRFADGGVNGGGKAWEPAVAILGGGDIATLNDVAARYGEAVAAAVTPWHAGSAGAAQATLVTAAIEAGLFGAFAENSAKLAASQKAIAALASQIPAPGKAPAMTDGSAIDESVFIRGSHKKLGDEVNRRFLEALDSAPVQDAGSGRLQLAQQMVDAQRNPFISRVIVNRLWHHLYGRGIVPTVDDFGRMGLPPTHPQLLDWLADDFVKGGWSVKRSIKQIVLSRAYQMSSRVDTTSDAGRRAEEADPANELLHRFPIRRLQAEAIRDGILTVSGRLDRTQGGPSVAVHLTPFMEGRGIPGRSGPLDGDGRRSVYIEIRRNFLPPMLMAFDFPNPFSAIGRRTVSNVPSQALILMNDPFVAQQAQVWAKRLLSQKLTPEERIEKIYESALSRPPTAPERAKLAAFITEQAKVYGASADDVRVWTDVCHVMFNMKEFVFLN